MKTSKMNEDKAIRRIKRAIAKIKPCPFCGVRPRYEWSVTPPAGPGRSWWHHASRCRCCNATANGGPAVAFSSHPHDRPCWRTFVNAILNDISYWNRRYPTFEPRTVSVRGHMVFLDLPVARVTDEYTVTPTIITTVNGAPLAAVVGAELYLKPSSVKQDLVPFFLHKPYSKKIEGAAK